jgi:hypothetical protein
LGTHKYNFVNIDQEIILIGGQGPRHEVEEGWESGARDMKGKSVKNASLSEFEPPYVPTEQVPNRIQVPS